MYNECSISNVSVANASVVCPSKQPITINSQVYEVWKLENGPDLSVSASTWSDRARGCVKGFVRVVARDMDNEKLCDVKHISEHEDRWNDHYGKKDKPMQKKSSAKPEHVKIRVYVQTEHLYNIQCSEICTLRNEKLHTEA